MTVTVRCDRWRSLVQCLSFMAIPRVLRLIVAAAGSQRTVFLVAFLVRVAVAFQLIPGNADRHFYQPNEPARIAWNLVSGRGYSSPWPNTVRAPTAQQPPVYPLLLAGIFRLSGAYSYLSLYIAILLNALFSAITAVLILRLGTRTFGRTVGIIAALIWSCWIYEVVVSLRLWESALSGMLLALGLWWLPELQDAGSLKWMRFGLLAGLAALTNAGLLPVFAGFWLWLWLSQKPGFRGRSFFASVTVCLLVLLPWTIRNYRALGRIVPLRDNFGLELWVGNHEGVTHLYDFQGGFPLSNPTVYNQLGEIAFMEKQRAVAVAFIRQHPGQFLRLCGERLMDFWTSPNPRVWLPVAVLAWLAIGWAWMRRNREVTPFAIVLVVFPLVYYVTHTWSTYRHPIEPEVILLAVFGTVEIVRKVILGGWARQGQVKGVPPA